ncbi:DUF992 domain-containing protein [Paracoccus salsus]|uniref:DUF992 domain-containing protein n=1 Tax=Paracoccus salsus TaxID=2911061 RepID=UPI001F3C0F53|nr:DUF992 domain-containing protein [Paracoccus salsus]MCF3975047.1 DUF992 domain-containing protein [Paracoccus salsus]
MAIKTVCSTVIALTILATPALADNHTQEEKPVEEVAGQELGQLSCTIDGGWGLLLGSSKEATCDFEGKDGTVVTYTGSLSRIGIDIGKTEEAFMTWAVFSKDDFEMNDEALLGYYEGLSAEANLGIGLGANALIGGTNKNIGLQPLSAQGSSGLNLAVGLASLQLDKVVATPAE